MTTKQQHPLNDAMDALNEAIFETSRHRTDREMLFDEELQSLTRRLAILMIAMDLDPELNDG